MLTEASPSIWLHTNHEKRIPDSYRKWDLQLFDKQTKAMIMKSRCSERHGTACSWNTLRPLTKTRRALQCISGKCSRNMEQNRFKNVMLWYCLKWWKVFKPNMANTCFKYGPWSNSRGGIFRKHKERCLLLILSLLWWLQHTCIYLPPYTLIGHWWQLSEWERSSILRLINFPVAFLRTCLLKAIETPPSAPILFQVRTKLW